MVKLAIFGPPGSGKGTYSSRIAPKLDIEHIATGDIFREMAKKDTEEGNRIEQILENGKLVDDETALEIIKDAIDGADGFIADGFPRTLNQAEELEDVIDWDAAINLDVTEDVIIKRLTSRRICRDCGEVYNILYLKPEEEGVCDECDGELYQRKDDKEKAIRERLETYEERSSPVVGFFKEADYPFINIYCDDVNAPVEEMVDKIMKKLKEENVIEE